MELMRLDDVVHIPNRGLVLVVSFVESDTHHITKLKKLVGSKITVSSVNETEFEFVIKDISVSFSISNTPLIGINIQERVDVEKIKKGSIIHLNLNFSDDDSKK
ncbi:hypothetical protein BBD42_07140 [Paenibacillus sp. BIHB 4019]|uniref:Uncharacterized protein n=1 Tax=Paenibacillus sp. BIHB 4019 TaxID=1870819 RepID=A0A1B2DEZ2_9BACL|nr:hypothetical protein [Paenibacillus sp. BIHB 4019]ANY66266.1 hypothetical protein BBD42_07140 [Paenibacillus sp. BIHB 4019]